MRLGGERFHDGREGLDVRVDVAEDSDAHAGVFFELEAEGLLAVAIQHEHDHLDGKLMVDHLGMLKKRMVHRQMVKRAAEAEAG
jgi:peptide deformylase